MLFNAVFRSNMLLSTLFLESDFKTTGLGVSHDTLSKFSLFSFLPAILLIFVSPLMVNNCFSDRIFLKGVVGIYMFSTLMVPTLRDILLHFGYDKYHYLIFLN